MAEEIKRKRTPPRNGKPAAGGTRKATAAKPAAKPVPPAAPPVIEVPPAPKPAVRTLKKLPPKDIEEPSLISRLMDLPGSMAGSAINFVVKKTELPLRVGKAMLLKQDQADVLEKAGKTFRELREVAGVTLDELAQEINLKDKSLLEAVENGTATLSFELIVRLASVLARHDPVPVALKLIRCYYPDLGAMLDDWGVGRWILHFEREREFINIYRRHDAVRQLSDEGFNKVLEFTKSAFEMALHFVANEESVEDQVIDPDAPLARPKNKPKSASAERPQAAAGKTAPHKSAGGADQD